MEGRHRRIIRALKRHAPGLAAEVVRETRHITVEFHYGERSIRYTMAGSPSVDEHEFRNTCTFVCKAFDLPRMRY